MASRKRRLAQAAAPPAAPPRAVRVGYSPEARAALDALPRKVRDGLRRKLRDFGTNPAIGKPLVGVLQGYHRVTYGRVRSIAEVIVRVANDLTIVMVLYVGLRKAGAADDPYEVAAIEALKAQDPDAVAAMEAMIAQLLAHPEAE
jgi:mRNA-degrading endonuclease RelE of RelBE toxin-antitoxin system